MNTLSKLLIAAVSALFLSACATSPFGATQTETDYAKIAAIERAAARNGVNVIWIQYPQKKVTVANPQGAGS